MKTILVVGGTGAQGAAVVRVLVSTGDFSIILFTRSTDSSQCQELLKLPNVEAVINPAAQGYDLKAFEAAARRSYGVFLNTDGFSLGEEAETYWGIRLYETAVKARVQHVIYSGLDDHYRNSGYDEKVYVGHFQGKARVQAYIQGRPHLQTAWTITRTGPYIEMLAEGLIPTKTPDGKYIFTIPLDDGEMVFIHLEDYGHYIEWIFRNPARSAGLDLGIGIAHTSGQDIASASTAVTGHEAVYQSVPIDAWAKAAFSSFPEGKDTKVGFRSGKKDENLNMTYGENFTNFFNLYKASKGNVGLVKRDYELLDSILPDRVKSAKEWMEKSGYTGETVALLKEFR